MGVKDLDDPKKLAMLRSQIDGITVEEIMDPDFRQSVPRIDSAMPCPS